MTTVCVLSHSNRLLELQALGSLLCCADKACVFAKVLLGAGFCSLQASCSMSVDERDKISTLLLATATRVMRQRNAENWRGSPVQFMEPGRLCPLKSHSPSCSPILHLPHPLPAPNFPIPSQISPSGSACDIANNERQKQIGGGGRGAPLKRIIGS